MIAGSHPILTCEEARQLESDLFGGEAAKEWAAMQAAGVAIARALLRDFQEIGGRTTPTRLLALVGKGHNGGDALIAALALARAVPELSIDVRFAFGERALKPLAAQAWRDLALAARERVSTVSRIEGAYDLCLDGVFGFQFRPPLDAATAALLEAANAATVRLRAAVDLPSGLTAEATTEVGFRADFTYATGSVKTPLADPANATRVGRVRYLDLGFFDAPRAGAGSKVLTADVLQPLRALRSSTSDKRTYGHVLILGGSRIYPGAVLMSVLAALRSGAGLVTALVPESLAPAFAARVPEAMWVGWPETAEGSLALEGQFLLRARLPRANALVIGPGLGREQETLALVRDVVTTSTVPLVLDADALQPDIVGAGAAARILTPHAGEFSRIAGSDELGAFAKRTAATVVLKGSPTRICSAAVPGGVYHSWFGGPVLARGGSGDLLAGIAGSLLAQERVAAASGDATVSTLIAATRAVVWHGLAADRLARAEGQVAVTTTQLLDHLGLVLRESEFQ